MLIKKIQEAKLFLLDCGGLGTHLLFDLAATSFQYITIVVFDTIELSNLNRQVLYHESDIGKVKVHQAKKRILEFVPRARVHAIEPSFDSTQKVPFINDCLDIRIGSFYTVLSGKSECVHCWKESIKQQFSQLTTMIIDKNKELDVNHSTSTPSPAMVGFGCCSGRLHGIRGY
ncbi:MAG: ThiF family adenylyltransferase [Bacteroidota bacterium]